MFNSTDSTPAERVALVIDAASRGTLDEVGLAVAVDEALDVANAEKTPHGLTLAEAVAVALDVHVGHLIADDVLFTVAVDAVVQAVVLHAARD